MYDPAYPNDDPANFPTAECKCPDIQGDEGELIMKGEDLYVCNREMLLAPCVDAPSVREVIKHPKGYPEANAGFKYCNKGGYPGTEYPQYSTKYPVRFERI